MTADVTACERSPHAVGLEKKKKKIVELQAVLIAA